NAAPSASASSAAPSAPAAPQPSAAGTLPVTGVLHPIRLMAGVAFGFVLVGSLLVYAGRRREGGVTDP
ncbi:MAG TPA: hypothetical protein VH442_15350, partial [Micromonosporaceae bacterium]